MHRGWIEALCALAMVGCAEGGDPARGFPPGPAPAGAGATAGDEDEGEEPDGDDYDLPDDDHHDVPDDDDHDIPDDDHDPPDPGGDDDDDDDVPGDDDDDDDDDDAGDSGGEPGEPAAVVFLDFDGATLDLGPSDDARIDQTMNFDLEGTWGPAEPGFADAIVERVQAALAPYAIEVTDVRPADGDYTMVIISADPSPIFGAAGLSAVDCGDLEPNNVAVVFGSAASSGVDGLGNVVLFQLGVTYGLNPAADPVDAMHNSMTDDALGFEDECVPIAGTPLCESMAEACIASEQSSHEELLARFGPA